MYEYVYVCMYLCMYTHTYYKVVEEVKAYRKFNDRMLVLENLE